MTNDRIESQMGRGIDSSFMNREAADRLSSAFRNTHADV